MIMQKSFFQSLLLFAFLPSFAVRCGAVRSRLSKSDIRFLKSVIRIIHRRYFLQVFALLLQVFLQFLQAVRFQKRYSYCGKTRSAELPFWHCSRPCFNTFSFISAWLIRRGLKLRLSTAQACFSPL